MGAKVVKLLATQKYSMLLGQSSCRNPAAKWTALVRSLILRMLDSNLESWKGSLGNPGSGSHPSCFTASVSSRAESDFTEHKARPWALVPPNFLRHATLFGVLLVDMGECLITTTVFIEANQASLLAFWPLWQFTPNGYMATLIWWPKCNGGVSSSSGSPLRRW